MVFRIQICTRLTATFLFFLSYSPIAVTQSVDYVLEDTSKISESQFQQLKQEFGKNKKIIAGYEKIIFYTLSYFSELKEHKIKFRLRDQGSPIAARPAWGDLWRSARKRTYVVLIRLNPKDAFSFSKAPIAGQIGILGHELCHVLNFSKKTSLDLIGLGINHISKKYMDRFEFYTDSLCIEKGLGYYLMSWAAWIENTFGESSNDFNNAGTNTPTGERYMGTATIKKYIQKSSAYRKDEGSEK